MSTHNICSRGEIRKKYQYVWLRSYGASSVASDQISKGIVQSVSASLTFS